MILLFGLLAIVCSLVLILVTLVQSLYMDTQRLRAKDLPFLDLFRATYSDRLGFKAEQGVLTFSLIKHLILAISGAGMVAITVGDDTLSSGWIVQAAVFNAVLMLLTSYIVPQVLYRHTSGTWFTAFIPVVKLLALAVRPITALLLFLQSLAQLGETDEQREEQPTPEENIEALISAGTEEGILEEEDRRLIHSVVAFGDKTVREVMTPRPSMVTVCVEVTLEELRKLVIHEQFSRIPVYEGSIDQIIGFIHVRDMFELDQQERTRQTIRDVVRTVKFVPESKPVNDLLREMQQDGNHIAIVVDEYGSTAGLITMEDMMEEIVGEIRDEHEPGHDVQPDGENGFIVAGSFDVDHLHDLVAFRADEGTESTTVGGLMTEWMGHVPQAGEIVKRHGISLEVLASNGLRVDKVRISKPEFSSNA